MTGSDTSILIYQADDGSAMTKVRLSGESVWLRQEQMAQLFGRELEAALQLVKKASSSPDLKPDTGRGLVDIVTRYAQTFLLLQRYDEGLLTEPREQQGGTLPTLDGARAALARLKTDLRHGVRLPTFSPAIETRQQGNNDPPDHEHAGRRGCAVRSVRSRVCR